MAKAKINRPTKEPSDPAYHVECEFALEPSFSKLVDEAVTSGWSARQVAYTLMVMAARTLTAHAEGSGPGGSRP